MVEELKERREGEGKAEEELREGGGKGKVVKELKEGGKELRREGDGE